MANWRERIDIGGVLHRANDKYDLSRVEEECPEEVRNKLAAEVEKSPTLRRFGAQFRTAYSIAAVNRVLARVYDAADRNLVWCGM